MTTNNLRSLTARLGLKLLAAEASLPKNMGKNVTIAPISIATALSMAAIGAQGKTYEQMRSVMGLTAADGDYMELSAAFASLLGQFKNFSADEGELATAQSIWKKLGTTVGADFHQQIAGDFGSQVWEFDPAYADNLGALNAWVAKATRNNIPEMLKVFNPLALMFLVSAVWFKAPWKNKFDPALTKDRKFQVRGLTAYSRQHPHMFQKGAYSGFCSTQSRNQGHALAGFDGLDFDGACLSFGKKGRLQHYALVPTNGSVQDLLDAMSSSPGNDYGFLGTSIDFGGAVGEILLPRYESDYGNNLKESLINLGMPDAFTNGVADFGRMLPSDSVFIGSVEHKAKLTINEEGGEGSGATVIDMTREAVSLPPMKLDIAFDRPFISAVVDSRTDAVLFLGVVNDPVDPGLKTK